MEMSCNDNEASKHSCYIVDTWMLE